MAISTLFFNAYSFHISHLGIGMLLLLFFAVVFKFMPILKFITNQSLQKRPFAPLP